MVDQAAEGVVIKRGLQKGPQVRTSTNLKEPPCIRLH
jgi:hypothetical protein